MESPQSPDTLVQMPVCFGDVKVYSASLGSLKVFLCLHGASIIDESLEISSVVSIISSFDRLILTVWFVSCYRMYQLVKWTHSERNL